MNHGTSRFGKTKPNKSEATAPHAVLAREVREWMAFWQNEPKLHRWPWRQSAKPFWQNEAKTHNRSTATQAGFGETNPTRPDGDADRRNKEHGYV